MERGESSCAQRETIIALPIVIRFVLMLALTASVQSVETNGGFSAQVGSAPFPFRSLVHHGETWRYRKGTEAPPAAWQTQAETSLDGSWLSGPGGIGYGDHDDGTELSDMPDHYRTVYIRKSFSVPSGIDPQLHLELVIDFDDGFVAYLDGVEIAREKAPGTPGTPPPFNALATSSHEASGGDTLPNPPITCDLGPVGSRLESGVHVLALQGFNQAIDSTDLSLIADLRLAEANREWVEGTYLALLKTNSVWLYGVNTLPNAVRVTVNGSDAMYDMAAGTWSRPETLQPGINRMAIQVRDSAGDVLFMTNKVVVFEREARFVGGDQETHTAWDRGAIIHVTNQVTIPAGGTLSISPGTIILLSPGASVVATNASIIVTGSLNNEVCFAPADGTSAWGELLVTGTNSHLLLQYAELIAGHLEVLAGGTGILEDSYLHDYREGMTPIIHTFKAASLTERRCHVARYYEHLIQLTPVLIEDCLCEHINGDGIDLDAAPPGSVLRRCTIRHGEATNVDGIDLGSYSDGTPSSGVQIEGCLIYDFTFDKGVSIGEAAGDIAVRNCLIYQVDTGVAIKDSARALIHNNTIVESNFGLRLYEKIAGQGPGHAVAYDNILWNNSNSIGLMDGSTLTITNSIIAASVLYPGAGNLNDDPGFLNAAQHDYRLAADSPAIGTGANGANRGAWFPAGSSLVDSDGDGMPDPWEQVHDLNPNERGDAGVDRDGDNRTSLQEYWSGTDPREARSVLRIASVERTDEGLVIRFEALAGKSYAIQYRDWPVKDSWSNRTEISASETNRMVEILDPFPGGVGARYYRLIIP